MENQNHETQSFERFKDRVDMTRIMLDQCERDAPKFNGAGWESRTSEFAEWDSIARRLASEAEHLVDCAINCANTIYEIEGSVFGVLQDATADALADVAAAAEGDLEDHGSRRSDFEEHGFGHAEYGIRKGRS